MNDNDTMIKVTHANNSAEAFIIKNKIFGYYYSEAHNSVLILSDAGAVFPVKESIEQISNLLITTKEENK